MKHVGLHRDLSEVKRILIEEGWCRGRLHSPSGYCLDGAILKAAGYTPPCVRDNTIDQSGKTDDLYDLMAAGTDTRLDAILKAVAEELPKPFGGDPLPYTVIFSWQDASTKEEVLAVIDKVMEKCK